MVCIVESWVDPPNSTMPPRAAAFALQCVTNLRSPAGTGSPSAKACGRALSMQNNGFLISVHRCSEGRAGPVIWGPGKPQNPKPQNPKNPRTLTPELLLQGP